MPWECKTVESERKEFIRRVESGETSMTVLCREYGISRPTGYKWLGRAKSGESLSDRSRRPFHTANRISEESERRIVLARKQEPAIGATKIRRMLIAGGWKNPPSISTINAVLHRNGLIEKEASLRAQPIKRFEKEAPNIMWQADFKGDYLLRDGTRCYPLSILDDHSRFCLCADAKTGMKLESTVNSFQNTFLAYGMPSVLLCDNGVPWGSSQSSSITKFEVWLMELGILPIHIRPGHPQTQGKVERFNGSFKRERLAFYTPLDMSDAQAQRMEYRDFYNNVRPHSALALDVPSAHYKESKRAFPSAIDEWEYECGCEVRKIKDSGYLSYNGGGHFLSEGLAGKTVAIVPSKKDGVCDILFRNFRVAKLDVRENCIIARRIYLIQNDPRLVEKL